MRGEFIRGDGWVIHNNITSFGAQYLLGLIAGAITSQDLYIGLGSAVYDPSLTTNEVNEPTLTNGYARQDLTRNGINWTVAGQVNGEWYMESVPVVFAATAGSPGFSQSISRMFLSDGQASVNIIALSGALPAPQLILPSTDPTLRTFKYRLYLR